MNKNRPPNVVIARRKLRVSDGIPVAVSITRNGNRWEVILRGITEGTDIFGGSKGKWILIDSNEMCVL